MLSNIKPKERKMSICTFTIYIFFIWPIKISKTRIHIICLKINNRLPERTFRDERMNVQANKYNRDINSIGKLVKKKELYIINRYFNSY